MNRARERVRDDAALVGDVSSAVSSALGLERTNKTLGRQVVIAVSLPIKRRVQGRSPLSSGAGGKRFWSGLPRRLGVLVSRRATAVDA